MTEVLDLNQGSLPPEHTLGNHELPIANHRAEIEAAIRQNSVTILVAPTGSGKTTQVPQYGREMSIAGHHEFDEIIVTQPRIVAARTVSERVGQETANNEQQHKVGYYTSKDRTLEPQRNQDIAFVTDGRAVVQLLKAGRQPESNKKHLLIIDEVHEWNTNIEQLIAIATERTDPQSPQYDANLKVVIMSATMDSQGLQQHFKHIAPPVIEVEVPTHKVTHSMANRAVASVALELAAKNKDKVLAFYPGLGEINDAVVRIANMQAHTGLQKVVSAIPLHGQQTKDEQNKAFDTYPNGLVIAASNAAETSLTVPGVVAVADSGQVRVSKVRYDKVPTGSEGLYLQNAAQANLKQRAGRAGRTQPGKYILCSPDGKLPPVPPEYRDEYEVPSIQSTRLDGMLLHLKASAYEVDDFHFFHKPPEQALQAARKRLFVLGALDVKGKITERGLQMEKLPLEPEFSCMVAFAYEKGYSDVIKANLLDIAAIMQLGGILSQSPKEKAWLQLLATNEAGEIAEKQSDFLAQLEAYVKLVGDTDPADWANYDIKEHSLGLVEAGRVTLARALGITLDQPKAVAPQDRQAVMTCINAGQLNQLWRRKGTTWSLAEEATESYALSGSSVVGALGELATGSLFSLGARGKTQDNIQDVNSVLSLPSLEEAAEHLITEVVDDDTFSYDHDKQLLMARIERRLGNLVMRSFQRPVDVATDSAEAATLQNKYRDQAWKTWQGHKESRTLYDASTIGEAIENPESSQYGTDPITGEPLYAWKGGRGQWCRSREVALESLVSHKARLEKAPHVAEQRAIKAEINEVSAELNSLIKSLSSAGSDGQRRAALIRKHRANKNKMTKEEWLEKARRLTKIA